MPTTIAFINLKGGVAKTTTTVATAHVLSGVHRKRVLVVDLDPQTNASVMLIGDQRWKELNDAKQTVAQLFYDAVHPDAEEFDLESSIQHGVGDVSEARTVSLLPSSLDLIKIQDELVTMPPGRYRANRPIDILYNALADRLDEFDYVLIDCPPSLGLITLNGLRLADGYVIPTVPDVLSTYGIPQIVSEVESFARSLREPIEPLGILLTKYQAQQTVHNTQLRVLGEHTDLPPVFEATIPQANELSAAPAYSQSRQTLRQKWGGRVGFPAYLHFVEELLERIDTPAGAQA
jgi:chromosome partitioning protein